MSQNQAAAVALLPGGGVGYLNLDLNGNLKTINAAGESAAAVPVAASSGNVANAAAVATLPAAAGKTTYISGLSITGAGATAAAVVTAALSGVKSGPLSFTVAAPIGVAVGLAPIEITFNPPLPASAVNTAIALTLPALGAGNTNAAVSVWGFQQ